MQGSGICGKIRYFGRKDMPDRENNGYFPGIPEFFLGKQLAIGKVLVYNRGENGYGDRRTL